MKSTTCSPRRHPGVRIALLGLALLWGQAAAQTGLLEQGLEEVNAGHPEAAYRLFSTAADAGEPEGAFGLGVLYFQGSGVTRDFTQSSRWFRSAAESGYAPAQFNLGNAYLYGRGVPKDPEQAERWWRKAARRGYARACFNLGSLLYKRGEDAASREEAIAWYRAAAERGFDAALERLEALGEPLDYRDIAPDPARQPWRDEARIMTLDPAGYTIQFFSARLPESVARFLTRHQLAGLALRYRFPHGAETWTGVVYGWYANRNEATATIDTLKPELKAAGPWPRPVTDIQAAIRVARGDEAVD